MIERNIIHIENAGLADKVIKFISLGILGVDRIRTLKRIDNNDDRNNKSISSIYRCELLFAKKGSFDYREYLEELF